MIDAIVSLWNERSSRDRPGRPRVEGTIVVGVDKDPASKVTFILFDRRGTPTAVAKVGRGPEAEAAVLAEHSILSTLWSSGLPTVTAQMPEPLALERIGRRSVMFVSAVRGAPMTTGYYSSGHVSDPRSVDEDFAIAGSWLTRLQKETARSSVTVGGVGFDGLIDPILDRYRRQIGWSPWERRLFDEVRQRVRDLRGHRLPLAAVHGDYWMGNILVHDGRLAGVVDWERSESVGLPFFDIYKFPTSYGFYLDRASPGNGGRVPGHPGRDEFRRTWRRFGDWPNLIGFAYAYFGRGWFPERVRSYVLGHLDRLGVPHQANAVFFPLFIADQATALVDPDFRSGYRSTLAALAEERDGTWLWQGRAAA
jgi:Phosphotransferase enzyme family